MPFPVPYKGYHIGLAKNFVRGFLYHLIEKPEWDFAQLNTTLTFWVQFLSLSIMLLRFIHIVECISISSLFISEYMLLWAILEMIFFTPKSKWLTLFACFNRSSLSVRMPVKYTQRTFMTQKIWVTGGYCGCVTCWVHIEVFLNYTDFFVSVLFHCVKK